MLRAGAALLLCAVFGPDATAAPDDYLSRLPAQVQQRLEEINAARGPKLVPPTPVAVTWKAMRIGSIDLGAPLGAFTAADLDGDGKSELYAVTAREVIAIRVEKGKPVELGRVAFDAERAVPAPRDVVGTAIVEGKELVAASSGWAKELRVTLAGGKLAAQPGAPGFLVCPGERWQLVPGRNYFAGELYGIRCRTMVDSKGASLPVRAHVNVAGKLDVELRVPAGKAAVTFGNGPVGIAFDVADIDRDGTLEVIVSGYVAPGDPDVVKVYGRGDKPIFTKKFNGGVVGIAVAENGAAAPTVIVAVRLAGATRVALWRLN